MYNQFFGFARSPFRIAPDPKFLFLSSQHQDGYGHLRYGVQQEGGFVLLSGEVGTGKTTLCRKLLTDLPEDTDIAFVLHPRLSSYELLATLCDELNIPYQDGQSEKHFIDRIYQHLLNAHSQGRNTILIVDEAQNLSPDVLEQIRLLTNLETDEQKLLQVILIGQPEILDLLAQPQLRQLDQRITARCHLGPLDHHQVYEYLKHRVAVGSNNKTDLVNGLFDSKVAKEICRLSRGIPRLINVIADRCLMAAYINRSFSVTLDMVRIAAKEVLPQQHLNQSTPSSVSKLDNLLGSFSENWFRPFMATLAVIAVVLLYTDQVRDVSREVFNSSGSSVSPAVAANSNQNQSSTTGASSSQSGQGFRSVQQIPYDGLAELVGISFFGCDDSPSACIEGEGDLNQVASLHIPMAVKLRVNGETKWALVEPLSNQTIAEQPSGKPNETSWNIYLDKLDPRNGDSIVMSAATFARNYKGEFALLWQPPSSYERPLKPGQKSNLVSWLKQKLPSVTEELVGQGWEVIRPNGQSTMPKLKVDNRYTSSLSEDVKRFQQQRGLVIDGIVGPMTIVHLQALEKQKGWVGLESN